MSAPLCESGKRLTNSGTQAAESFPTCSDGSGTEYVQMMSSSYNFGKYDLGGFSKSVSPKLSVQTQKTAPKHDPNFTATDVTTPEQALLYRLSG